MDTGVGSSSPLLATVVPDHQDPNLFYVFPSQSDLVLQANGKQEFLYIENRRYSWGKFRVEAAHVSLTVRPSATSPELDLKTSEIRTANPNAKFAVVTAFKTEVITGPAHPDFFVSTYCPTVNGPLEVAVSCEVEINPLMSRAFRHLLSLTEVRVFHLVYSFYGWADGQMREYRYAVPIKMGSFDRGGYFFDQYGEPI
jgi:hypothetical protein